MQRASMQRALMRPAPRGLFDQPLRLKSRRRGQQNKIFGGS
jgi:hypothetical protein